MLATAAPSGCYRSHGRGSPDAAPPSSSDGGPPRLDAGLRLPDAGPLDAGSSDAGALDAGTEPCDGCLATPLAWGFLGGLFPSRRRSEITGCARYVRTLEDDRFTVLECATELRCAEDAIPSVAVLDALLNDPALQRVFDEGPRVFVSEPAPPDAPSFAITYRGETAVLGGACAFGPCDATPPALDALRERLVEIDEGLDSSVCLRRDLLTASVRGPSPDGSSR